MIAFDQIRWYFPFSPDWLLHSPPRLRDDHLRAGLVELFPQLALVKNHFNVLDVLKEIRRHCLALLIQPNPDYQENMALLNFSISSFLVVVVPGWARWRWERWELWTDPVVAPLKGDRAELRPGPGSCIHPSQLKPSPAASLRD